MDEFRPRPYQAECFEAIRAAMKRGVRKPLAELSTGLGKTIIFSMISQMAHGKGHKTLILCNRDQLVKQAADKLRKSTGIIGRVDKAEEKASMFGEVVIGSVQTMQGARLTRWPKDHFKLVVCDEVHYAASKTFRSILTHFEEAYHIGVSATIERADGQGVGWFYDEIVFEMPLYSRTEYTETGEVARVVRGGINEGWLAPIKVKQIPVPVTIDERISNAKNITEQQEAFALSPYLQKLCNAIADEIRTRKSLIFCADCKSSEAVAQMLCEAGIDAQHVDSTYLSPNETQKRLKWFEESGRGSCMVNASLLTTGYDNPSIDCIVPLRLIKSTPLYKQIIGRGTRVVCNVDSCDTAEDRRLMIDMSAKPDCLVLDLLLQNEEHDFVSPACLVSKLNDESKSLAKKHGGFQDETDLSLLQAESDKQRLTDIEQRLKKTAEAIANRHERQRTVTKDIYIGDILKRDGNGDIASEKQIGFMRSLGVKLDFGSVTKRQASRIIARYVEHRDRQKQREEMIA